MATLKTNKLDLEMKVKETAVAYATEAPGIAKEAIHSVLVDYDAQIKELDFDIASTQATDMESEDFVNFAIQFVENIRTNWWKLSWENMARGVQILFYGKIYANNTAIVRPPALSPIYRLGTNKKALSNMDNAHLVELVGTAPTSASLSWLDIYRYRSFKNLGHVAVNDQKLADQSPKS